MNIENLHHPVVVLAQIAGGQFVTVAVQRRHVVVGFGLGVERSRRADRGNGASTAHVFRRLSHDKRLVRILVQQVLLAYKTGQLWHLLAHVVDKFINGSMLDRKSTRLNSSHVAISYAVFCLKKNKRN